MCIYDIQSFHKTYRAFSSIANASRAFVVATGSVVNWHIKKYSLRSFIVNSCTSNGTLVTSI